MHQNEESEKLMVRGRMRRMRDTMLPTGHNVSEKANDEVLRLKGMLPNSI